MDVIPNPKIAFIFPISCILALIFPILINIFPNGKEKVASFFVLFLLLYVLSQQLWSWRDGQFD